MAKSLPPSPKTPDDPVPGTYVCAGVPHARLALVMGEQADVVSEAGVLLVQGCPVSPEPREGHFTPQP